MPRTEHLLGQAYEANQSMWKLVIVDDQSQRTVVNLVRDEYTIGRDHQHSVRLTERNISRRHATISRSRTGFRLEDLGSYNGVYVNGVRLVGRQELAHGDLVQLGDYRVHIVDEAIDTQEQGYRPYSGDGVAPASGRLPHRLVELIGPHQGAEYPLDGERFLIGRGPECEFVIDHGSVSRVHAEVRRIGEERFEILDKGSANGLRINGHERDRAILDGRDVLEIGDVVLKYIPQGQVFRASPAEGTRIAAMAGSSPPPEEKSARTGLGASMLAAALGALLVGSIALFSFRGSENEAPVRDPVAEVFELIDSGSLLEAGELLQETSSSSSPLEHTAAQEAWAEAVLRAQASGHDEEALRKLLDLVAKRESLAPSFRERAQQRLSSMSSGAVDLNALEEAPATP